MPSRGVGSRAGRLVTVGVAGALAPIAVLQIAGNGRVDPLSRTVSDYVALRSGALPWGALLLATSALALAVAGTALARHVLRRGLPGARAVATLTVVWVVALVLVAVFPTNVDGAPADLAAVVHRWSGAVVLALPPILALLVARGAAARGAPVTALRRLTLATAVVDGAFLLSHVPIVVLGSSGFPLLGLVERVLYALVIALLPVMSTAVRVGTARAASAVPAPGPALVLAAAGGAR